MSGNALTIAPVPLPEPTRRSLDRFATTIIRTTAERDHLICQAYQDGASMREIARAVHMTHPGVRNILIRNGVYDPSRGPSDAR